MSNTNILEELKVQPMSQEEKEKRHILNRLAGPISSSKEETRNGRFYNSELWTNALNDPIFQEKIKNKSLFLELGHPVDRDETDMSCVCACIPEMPKIIDGVLYAIVDVLDTPNGRLLNTLIDYGFTPGISSRGTGDVDANNEVDPNTFMLETWDIVQVPSLESARLNLITEGLNVDGTQKQLKKALKESLKNETPENKKIMKETLKNLGIKLTETKKSDINTQKSDNINSSKEVINENLEVEDNKSNQIVKDLKEALISKGNLETKVQSLQEQLAASDTRAKALEEELKNYKKSLIRLSAKVRESKNLKNENDNLKEQLENKTNLVKTQNDKISSLRNEIKSNSTSLNESLSLKDRQLKSLQEKLSTNKRVYEEKISKLNEEFDNIKSDAKKKVDDLTTKLNKSIKLVEKYKNYVVNTVDRYIESKARTLGITTNEIKNRLNESYTIDDIDRICEDLQSYNLRISKLPFSIEKDTKVKFTESKQSRFEPISPDDDVSGLLELMKK